MRAVDLRQVTVLLQSRIHSDAGGIAREMIEVINGRVSPVPEHRRLWAVVADAIIVCSRCRHSRALRTRYHALILRDEIKHLPHGAASLLVKTLANVLRGRNPHPDIAAALVDPVRDVSPWLVAHFALQHGNVRTNATTRCIAATLRAHLVGQGPCTVAYLNREGEWVPFTRTTTPSDVAGVVRVTDL